VKIKLPSWTTLAPSVARSLSSHARARLLIDKANRAQAMITGRAANQQQCTANIDRASQSQQASYSDYLTCDLQPPPPTRRRILAMRTVAETDRPSPSSLLFSSVSGHVSRRYSGSDLTVTAPKVGRTMTFITLSERQV